MTSLPEIGATGVRVTRLIPNAASANSSPASPAPST